MRTHGTVMDWITREVEIANLCFLLRMESYLEMEPTG
jgi:hypothetical protein